MLGHIGQDQVGRDRRHLIQPGLAELALDIVFARKAKTAMRLDAGIGRLPAGIGRQQLGHVRLRPAIKPGVKTPARLKAHQVGSLDIHIGAGDGKLHTLILTDGAISPSRMW